MIEHAHREVWLVVNSVNPKLSQTQVRKAYEEAEKALAKLGKVEIIQTPEAYRKV
jgi:hypothetical protein